jgi:hypothetical protein
MGIVVELSLEEFDLLMAAPTKEKEHSVRRKRCTFLPGVNAGWDTYFASLSPVQQLRLQEKWAHAFNPRNADD